jgi:hypothetical protein
MLNPDPRYLEYGIRVERETPKPVAPIQVRAREPAGLLPRHDAIDLCKSVDGASAVADKALDVLGSIEDILDLYPFPTGYAFVNPLDYLELTARAA